MLRLLTVMDARFQPQSRRVFTLDDLPAMATAIEEQMKKELHQALGISITVDDMTTDGWPFMAVTAHY